MQRFTLLAMALTNAVWQFDPQQLDVFIVDVLL
jgi:hypothetical protein